MRVSANGMPAKINKNSSGDETANVNFLRRNRTRTSKYQKKEPTSFNKLYDLTIARQIGLGLLRIKS